MFFLTAQQSPFFIGNTGRLISSQDPDFVVVQPNNNIPFSNGLFGGFGGRLTPALRNVALGSKGFNLHTNFPVPSSNPLIFSNDGTIIESAIPAVLDDVANNLPNALGNDPIKASFLAARSNPLIHLLAAPYIKNIKENNGEDLPTLEDIQNLLERSSFGLSGFGDE